RPSCRSRPTAARWACTSSSPATAPTRSRPLSAPRSSAVSSIAWPATTTTPPSASPRTCWTAPRPPAAPSRTATRCRSPCTEAMRRAGVPEAPEIKRLPERVEFSSLRPTVGRLPVLGLADETLAELSYEPRGAFMVTGPMGSGRTTAMLTIATGLKAMDEPMRLVRVSSRRTALTGLPIWDVEASDPETVRELAGQLRQTIESGTVGEGKLALFIDGVADFTGSGVENDLDKLIRASTREGQFVVGENESASW